MLCELSNRSLTDFIRGELRGDKRNFKLIDILLFKPIMAFTATALGNLILNSDEDAWQEASNYSPMLWGYPFVFVMFMGICITLCNTKRELNDNPYENFYERVSWKFELTLSKIHCEPYGTVANGFTIAAWSTVITPTAALMGNAMLQRIDNAETAKNIIAMNAWGGAMVGVLSGTAAILYNFFKTGAVNCGPESDRYIYKVPCSLPDMFIKQDLDNDECRNARFPSLSSLTPFNSYTSITQTPILNRRNTSSSTKASTTPCINLNHAYNKFVANIKDGNKKERQQQQEQQQQQQWLLLNN